jgi:hypothetical protein
MADGICAAFRHFELCITITHPPTIIITVTAVQRILEITSDANQEDIRTKTCSRSTTRPPAAFRHFELCITISHPPTIIITVTAVQRILEITSDANQEDIRTKTCSRSTTRPSFLCARFGKLRQAAGFSAERVWPAHQPTFARATTQHAQCTALSIRRLALGGRGRGRKGRSRRRAISIDVSWPQTPRV